MTMMMITTVETEISKPPQYVTLKQQESISAQLCLEICYVVIQTLLLITRPSSRTLNASNITNRSGTTQQLSTLQTAVYLFHAMILVSPSRVGLTMILIF